MDHYHQERNPQGKNNLLLFPVTEVLEAQPVVANGSMAYSTITAMSHEFI